MTAMRDLVLVFNIKHHYVTLTVGQLKICSNTTLQTKLNELLRQTLLHYNHDGSFTSGSSIIMAMILIYTQCLQKLLKMNENKWTFHHILYVRMLAKLLLASWRHIWIISSAYLEIFFDSAMIGDTQHGFHHKWVIVWNISAISLDSGVFCAVREDSDCMLCHTYKTLKVRKYLIIETNNQASISPYSSLQRRLCCC